MADIDFAHTSEANRRREEKAKTLARHLYDNLVDGDEAAGYGDATHRRIERAAGVRRCGDETWALVVDLLRRRMAYDAAHAPAVDEADEEATSGDTPTPRCEDGGDTGASHSDGGDPCEHFSDGDICGARPTRMYLLGDRCPLHTPAALLGRPEAIPDPMRNLNGLREAAGLPTSPVLPSSTVVDLQALASGKRRSNPQTYRAARQAQQDSRGRRRAAG